MMRGDIEERDEDRISGRAHHGEIDPARAQSGPVLPQRRAGGNQNGNERHRPLRHVSVIGPIWPTANRPTIEWAAQISVVMTSNRIGFAQADCMSPVLGAVASVMTVFEDFEDCPKLTLGGMRSVTLERD